QPAAQPKVEAAREMAGSEERSAARVDDHSSSAKFCFELVFGKHAQSGQATERWRACQVHLHVMRKVGRPVREVFNHSPNEWLSFFDLERPIKQALLANGAEGRRRNFAATKRTRAVGRPDFRLVPRSSSFWNNES